MPDPRIDVEVACTAVLLDCVVDPSDKIRSAIIEGLDAYKVLPKKKYDELATAFRMAVISDAEPNTGHGSWHEALDRTISDDELRDAIKRSQLRPFQFEQLWCREIARVATESLYRTNGRTIQREAASAWVRGCVPALLRLVIEARNSSVAVEDAEVRSEDNESWLSVDETMSAKKTTGWLVRQPKGRASGRNKYLKAVISPLAGADAVDPIMLSVENNEVRSFVELGAYVGFRRFRSNGTDAGHTDLFAGGRLAYVLFEGIAAFGELERGEERWRGHVGGAVSPWCLIPGLKCRKTIVEAELAAEWLGTSYERAMYGLRVTRWNREGALSGAVSLSARFYLPFDAWFLVLGGNYSI
jgi:hypothetical protein